MQAASEIENLAPAGNFKALHGRGRLRLANDNRRNSYLDSRAAGPPHKGQTCAVGLAPSVGSMFYLILTERGDASGSISLLVFGRRGTIGMLEYSSR